MTVVQNKSDIPKVSVVAYTVAVLITAATVLVYLPALQNDFVLCDDQLYVDENSHIRSLDTEMFKWALLDFHAANWYPLTFISHAIDSIVDNVALLLNNKEIHDKMSRVVNPYGDGKTSERIREIILAHRGNK